MVKKNKKTKGQSSRLKSNRLNSSGLNGARNKSATTVTAALQSVLEQVQRDQNNARLVEADEQFKQLIATYPQSAQVHFHAGRYFYETGRRAKAVRLMEHSLKIKPGFIECLIDLAVMQHYSGMAGAADNLRKVLALNPKHIDALVRLGKVLSDDDQQDAAQECFSRALGLDPNRLDALEYMASIARFNGDMNEAKRYYRKILALNPRDGLSHRMIATMSMGEADAGHRMQMQVLFRDTSVDSQNRMHLAFGLGKVCDSLGEYQQSFDYYVQANQLIRQTYSIKSLDYGSELKKIMAYISPDYLQKLRGFAVSVQQSPIFILGMPRSGTSMVEQILASHSAVFGAGEFFKLGHAIENIAYEGLRSVAALPQLPMRQLVQLVCHYCDNIQTRAGDESFVTDKTPHNFQFIGLILAILPNAKIVHCVRDPRATCVSIFTEGFSSGHPYASSLPDLGGYYRAYSDLMDYWTQQFPDKIYTVNYEAITQQPEPEICRLLDYCQLDFQPGCLAFHENKRAVLTPSFQQVRQPIHKKAIDQWRRYAPYLEPLLSVLEG